MMYKSDIEIAQSVPMKPIQEIAASLGLDDESYELYGKYKCKVDYNLLESMNDREDGKLVLVTHQSHACRRGKNHYYCRSGRCA